MKSLKFVLALQTATFACLLSFVAPATAQTNAAQNTVASSAANAQEAATSVTLSGNWKRQETAQQQAARFKVIDQVTSKMGRFKRSTAQEKLRAATALKESLSIVDAGNKVTLGPTGGQRMTVTPDGKIVKLNGPNNSGTVQSARQNGSLLVKVDGDKGSRTTKYTLSNDKTTLTMDVSLSNPNLPQPIQFQMTYVRAAAAANARGATGAAGR